MTSHRSGTNPFPDRWLAYGDRRRARRAAARRLHPDVGGSATALAQALAEIDAAYGDGITDMDVVGVTVVHRTIRGRIRRLVRLRRAKRRRLVVL